MTTQLVAHWIARVAVPVSGSGDGGPLRLVGEHGYSNEVGREGGRVVKRY